MLVIVASITIVQRVVCSKGPEYRTKTINDDENPLWQEAFHQYRMRQPLLARQPVRQSVQFVFRLGHSSL